MSSPKELIDAERARLLAQVLPAPTKTKKAGMVALHEQIRHLTHGGEELVAFAFEIMRNEGECFKLTDRITMHKWLSEYGFGRPKETIEVSVGQDERTEYNLMEKSPEELEALEGSIAMALALAKGSG